MIKPIDKRSSRWLVFFVCVFVFALLLPAGVDAQVISGPKQKYTPGHIPTIEATTSQPDSLEKELPILQRKQAVNLSYQMDYYRDNEQMLHHVMGKYKRDWEKFSLELSAIWAQRFSFTGQNYGLGLYPQITKSTYLKLKGSYSVDSIYPDWSAGGSLVQGIGSWLELEGGYRYVQFPSQKMEIYTAGIGFYPGNWEIKGWGYYSEDGKGDFYSGSGRIRYLGNDDNSYIGVQGGYGPISEGVHFLRDQIRLNQYYGSLIWSLKLNPSWNLVGRAGYYQEEIQSGKQREVLKGQLGFVIKF
jgi:YaiO family outer membrane protein